LLILAKAFQCKPPLILLVNGIKESTHPNAYLKHIRNVSCGLQARTKILNALETNPLSVSRIASGESMSYSVVLHHLRLLESEGIVHRKGRRPFFWVATGLGQKRL
jgi:DNA-binding transcriptional ArsR family regulator